MTRLRTLVIGAVLALTALGSPAAAGEGIHLEQGAADEYGCFAVDVMNGDALVKTIPADPGPYPDQEVHCATTGVSRHLPNGTLLFERTTHHVGYFGCCSQGTRLWASDGTADGTLPVADLGGDPEAYLWQVIGRTAYISAVVFDSQGAYQYGTITMTRGTLATTRIIKHVGFRWLNEVTPVLPFYKILGTRVYFSAPERSGGVRWRDGREMWMSNGTLRGTVILKDIRPGPLGSDPQNLAKAAGRLVFTANDGHGRAWWISDGTRPGTHKAR